MMLTEAEARTQTCPLIRYCVNEQAVVQDGAPALYANQLCQGKDCQMGWRWRQDRDGKHRVGYCGAFGRPESA